MEYSRRQSNQRSTRRRSACRYFCQCMYGARFDLKRAVVPLLFVVGAIMLIALSLLAVAYIAAAPGTPLWTGLVQIAHWVILIDLVSPFIGTLIILVWSRVAWSVSRADGSTELDWWEFVYSRADNKEEADEEAIPIAEVPVSSFHD